MANKRKNPRSDEYYTPKYLFDAMGVSFDLDAAAPVDRTHCHVPANGFITEKSLSMEWNGFVWLNPPFGARNSKDPWFRKMEDHGSGIILGPDRTSAPWWVTASDQCDLILLVNHKVKFGTPLGVTADSPEDGVTLFAYGAQGVQALLNAQQNKLGFVFKRFKKLAA